MAGWVLVLTGVGHFKAVTDVHNVDLGKELGGFCELRQRKPKSRMFLGLLIRKQPPWGEKQSNEKKGLKNICVRNIVSPKYP